MACAPPSSTTDPPFHPAHTPQASDFRVAQICGNRYVIHLGRWPGVQKRYQGGWGGGPQLQLPCPMPPSAVAASHSRCTLDSSSALVARAAISKIQSRSLSSSDFPVRTRPEMHRRALHSSCFRRDQGRKTTSNTNRKIRRRID